MASKMAVILKKQAEMVDIYYIIAVK